MNAAAQTACPRCNGALAPGAQFCGACGSPIGAAPPPPQAPYTPPPQMPQMPQMPAMARSFGGGGNSKQINLSASAPEAFNTAMRVLEGAGAEVHWRQPPQGAKFLLTRKSFWSTMGAAIKYDGDLNVASAGPGQSSARLSLKLRWGSAAGLLLGQAALVLVGSMFNIYLAYYGLFFIAISVGITAWTLSSSVPEKALKELSDQIAAGGGGFAAPAQPQPPAYGAPSAPQPAPAYGAPPVAPVAPAPAPAQADETAKIMEQIRQLGALRDAGVLSVAEFDAKKAELLARI